MMKIMIIFMMVIIVIILISMIFLLFTAHIIVANQNTHLVRIYDENYGHNNHHNFDDGGDHRHCHYDKIEKN